MNILNKILQPFAINARNQWRHLVKRFDTRTLTKEQFVGLLDSLGVVSGVVVMMHSSMDHILSRVPELDAMTLIRLIQSKVGAEGTVLMPTFPFMGYQREYVLNHRTFNVKTTPSKVGLLTEVFRRCPDVSRSLHPTHPVATWGKYADELISEHHLGSAFGENSPFYKMRELNGLFVGLGVPPITFTLNHVAEELHPITYNYNYDNTIIRMEVISDDMRFDYDVNILRTDRHRNYWPAINILKSENILRHERHHGLEVCCVSVKEFLERSVGIIESGQFQKY